MKNDTAVALRRSDKNLHHSNSWNPAPAVEEFVLVDIFELMADLIVHQVASDANKDRGEPNSLPVVVAVEFAVVAMN